MFEISPAHVTYVAVDFNKQELDVVMTKTDFDPGAKALFIWEGVSQYITAEAVDAIFRYLLSAATPESQIIFTYINRRIIEGIDNFKGSMTLKGHHARLSESWIFGIDPDEISSFFNQEFTCLIDGEFA